MCLTPSDDSIVHIEEQDMMARAMASLTERQRAAVVLIDLMGYSSEEVGRMLGVDASTVRSHIKRAHAELKTRMDASMIEYTKLIERLGERYGVPDLSTDQLLNRRDRKRRNQRIAAGVVGIAVFVAAVWIVTSVLPLDRSEKVVPATSGTTGPAETGPTGPPDATWDGTGIPPKGTRLSTPVEGEFVRRAAEYHRYLAVYADGRVLSWAGGTYKTYVLERRLTPRGVARLRSGAIKPGSSSPFQWRCPRTRGPTPRGSRSRRRGTRSASRG
jgi:DNA-binding CsgD family transcriptional regulator